MQALWESKVVIMRFAGATPQLAVVEPEAAAVLLRFDTSVTHHAALVAPIIGDTSAA